MTAIDSWLHGEDPQPLTASLVEDSERAIPLRYMLTFSFAKAFENTSTSVAASQMRNALNNLGDTVKDPQEKKVSSKSPCASA